MKDRLVRVMAGPLFLFDLVFGRWFEERAALRRARQRRAEAELHDVHPKERAPGEVPPGSRGAAPTTSGTPGGLVADGNRGGGPSATTPPVGGPGGGVPWPPSKGDVWLEPGRQREWTFTGAGDLRTGYLAERPGGFGSVPFFSGHRDSGFIRFVRRAPSAAPPPAAVPPQPSEFAWPAAVPVVGSGYRVETDPATGDRMYLPTERLYLPEPAPSPQQEAPGVCGCGEPWSVHRAGRGCMAWKDGDWCPCLLAPPEEARARTRAYELVGSEAVVMNDGGGRVFSVAAFMALLDRLTANELAHARALREEEKHSRVARDVAMRRGLERDTEKARAEALLKLLRAARDVQGHGADAVLFWVRPEVRAAIGETKK